jgi:hypothetical protein
MKKPCLVLFSLLLVALAARPAQAQAPKLPDTGISGVYEVMVGTRQAQPLIKYFGEFGFRVVDSAAIPAERAKELYGVASALKTYRLQNGDIDSHGLLRLLEWANPLGDGVGYSMPETIGQRMAVMMTKDVIRLVDLYKAERANGKKWLPFDPIFDDLYGLGSGQPGFFNRPVGVRETVVYGDFFVHVFFQRYGYTIPGYGTIGSHAPLQTSEFTHHDFVVKGDLKEVTRYYSEALGLQPEEPEPVIDGDWQKGPSGCSTCRPATRTGTGALCRPTISAASSNSSCRAGPSPTAPSTSAWASWALPYTRSTPPSSNWCMTW